MSFQFFVMLKVCLLVLKNAFLHSCDDPEVKIYISSLFPYKMHNLNEGFKYLGFHLKPNGHRKDDWLCLVQRIQMTNGSWSFRCLSLGGRMVSVSSILQRIPVLWVSLFNISDAVLSLIIRFFIFHGMEN